MWLTEQAQKLTKVSMDDLHVTYFLIVRLPNELNRGFAHKVVPQIKNGPLVKC